ncbi:MAG: hypothetical protein GWP06_12205 [Actinobacteria bacterium]|nr:hypothetical protein [Actinomycetota bacterium]
MQTIRILHPIVAVILIAGYLYLGLRLLRKKEHHFTTLEVTLSQVVRISLLLAYLTGLLMSMNLGLRVAKIHHYASLIPVAVIFIFQFLPQLLRREIGIKGAAWMFLAMFVAVLVIAVTSGFANYLF